MDQYCIPLLVDTQRSDHQDNKISSSSLRELRLGTVIKPVAVMLQLSWEIVQLPLILRKLSQKK